MSLIHMMAAVVGVFKALERRCPKCRSKQIAAPSEKGESIICTECGTPIPSATETDTSSLPP